MKAHITLIIFMALGLLGFSQPTPTLSENYIETSVAREAVSTLSDFDSLNSVDEKLVSIGYFDGLGRPTQSVSVAAAPSGADLYAFQSYDDFGRSPKQYLPFTSSTANGGYLLDPATSQDLWYTNALNYDLAHIPLADRQKAFAETVFDDSPLNRVVEQGAPGASWQIDKDGSGHSTSNGHTVRTSYRTNEDNIGIDHVRLWVYDPATDQFSTTTDYDEGELRVVETKDENDHRQLSYQNKLGQIILTRSQVDNSTSDANPQSWANTYYLYDDEGYLRYVIQPEGVDLLWTNSWNLYDLSVQDFVFYYEYDQRGRMVKKLVPGADSVYMVYDPLDQMVLSQDGNLRYHDQWLFTKYDAFGRPVMTGIFHDATESQTDLQTQIDGHGSYFESADTNVMHGYSNQAFPVLALDTGIHSITYYDHYDFDRNGSIASNETYETEPGLSSVNLSSVIDTDIKGLVSGIKVRILDGTNSWLFTRTFYDTYGREVQTVADNHLGGTDRSTYELNFAGEMLKSYHLHHAAAQTIGVYKEFEYDHQGRLTKSWQRNDNISASYTDSLLLLAQQNYDELGKLKEKNLHSRDQGLDFLQSVDYKYNIRDWLVKINQIDSCDVNDEIINSIDVVLNSVSVDLTERTYGGVQALEMNIQDDKTVSGQVQGSNQNSTYNGSLTAQTYQIVSNPNINQTINISFGGLNVEQGSYSAIQSTISSNLNTVLGAVGVPSGDIQIIDSVVFATVATELDNVYSGDDSDDLFSMTLRYGADTTGLPGSPNAQYNGNIAGMIWQSADQCTPKGYSFSYDALNRLTSAHYAEQNVVSGAWSLADHRYSLPSISYDLNGNILSLERKGLIDLPGANPSWGLMDDLQYTYQGNQLLAVEDQVASLHQHEQFVELVSLSTEYTYDANGNMVADANSALSVTYDHLNKPTEVSLSAGEKIEYLYSADGTKLRQVQKNSQGIPIKQTDYIGGFHYEDSSLQFFAHEEGRIRMASIRFEYEYNLTDHLGNVRVSIGDVDQDGAPEVLETHQYYPFGMRHYDADYTPQTAIENQYLYNGKERQDEFDLNWYDYGARMYNPAVARWNGVDQLADMYQPWSPYNYTLNNPIKYIDPDGRIIYDADGNVVVVSGNRKTGYSFSTENGNTINAGTLKILNSLNKNKDGRKQIQIMNAHSKMRKLILSPLPGLYVPNNEIGGPIRVSNGFTLRVKDISGQETDDAIIYVYQGTYELNKRKKAGLIPEEIFSDDSYSITNTEGEIIEQNVLSSEVIQRIKEQDKLDTKDPDSKLGIINQFDDKKSAIYEGLNNYKASSLEAFIEMVSIHESFHPSEFYGGSWLNEKNTVEKEINYYQKYYEK